MSVMTNESGQEPAPRANEGGDPGWFPMQPQEGPEGGHWQGHPANIPPYGHAGYLPPYQPGYEGPGSGWAYGPPPPGGFGPPPPGGYAPHRLAAMALHRLAAMAPHRPAAMAHGRGRERRTRGAGAVGAVHWRSLVEWWFCWWLAPLGDSSAMPSAVPATLG